MIYSHSLSFFEHLHVLMTLKKGNGNFLLCVHIIELAHAASNRHNGKMKNGENND